MLLEGLCRQLGEKSHQYTYPDVNLASCSNNQLSKICPLVEYCISDKIFNFLIEFEVYSIGVNSYLVHKPDHESYLGWGLEGHRY